MENILDALSAPHSVCVCVCVFMNHGDSGLPSDRRVDESFVLLMRVHVSASRSAGRRMKTRMKIHLEPEPGHSLSFCPSF